MPEPSPRGRAALLHLSATLALRDEARTRAALRRAAAEADAAAVEEVILQAHLFVGFPDALNALAAWREVGGLPAPAGAGEDPAGWEARGERVCAAVYGANYGRLRENVRALHPDFDGWMVAGGYGRVIGRPGLDLATRELCIAALLAAWNVPRQLHSHLRGALNAGAAPAEVDEAVEAACALLDAARAAGVRRLWAEIRAKALSAGGDG
ncbi:MAG TPA: carboxymuconolactone decarboxylase family protein [Longimicrobiaceae bacterium]|nr:carboxymuconolactone decarboxylase family protein [Longimicrobiaceae bacterium]